MAGSLATLNGPGVVEMLDGTIDYLTDTIKAALVSSNLDYTNARYMSAVTESSGTGYTAGGVTLTGKTLSWANGSEIMWSCDSFSFTSVTVTAKYIAIYKDTGDYATSRIFGYLLLPGAANGAKNLVGDTITVNPSVSDGLFQIKFTSLSLMTLCLRFIQ